MIYYPIPVHKSGAFERVHSWDLNRCEQLSDTVFSVPMHPYLEAKDIEMICDELIKIVR